MEDNASRAKRYRDKAEELQRLALQMSSNLSKQMFIEMATDYLHMAERLERIDGTSDASGKL